MKLLYFREHLSCMNYQLSDNTGFVNYELDKGSVSCLDNAISLCILFLLEGKISIAYGDESDIVFGKNKMLLIPQRVDNKITALQHSQCLVLFWDKNIGVCDKMYIESLHFTKGNRKTICPLVIRTPVLNVLQSISTYLDARLQCKHMHQIKQEELLLVLRGFYTKRELYGFFAPAFEQDNRFEEFVLKNYNHVKTVKGFADLYCSSERSFSRKFQTYFSESPYKWMQKKKAELLLERICKSDESFYEISLDCGFSSPGHFTAYCKRQFGQTPTELREQELQKDTEK